MQLSNRNSQITLIKIVMDIPSQRSKRSSFLKNSVEEA